MPIFVFIIVFCFSVLMLTDWDERDDKVSKCEKRGGVVVETISDIHCTFPLDKDDS